LIITDGNELGRVAKLTNTVYLLGMEASKLNEGGIKNFGLFVLMLILFGLLIFIESFGFNTEDTNQTLKCSHDDFFVGSGVVHESDGLRRDLSCAISVCR
jgi:hypothetical protein